MSKDETAKSTPSHPNWPANTKCLFTEWMPYSKTEIYRVCAHPQCNNWEKKSVSR